MDKRIENEIVHGKYLKEKGAGKIWNWDTPTGKIRLARRVKMLTSHIKSDMRVLEIGCGEGYFTQHIAKTDAQIVAIDISPDLIDSAKSTVTSKNVTFEIENAYEMSFDDETFDTIVGSSTLHHLEIDSALKEFYRVLKPGGSIYFTEPNMLNPHIVLERKIPALRKLTGVSPNETAFFRWSLRKIMRKHGFVNVKVTPFDFLHPSIPKSILSVVKPLCSLIEYIPIVVEIAGSVYVRGEKAR